MQSDKTNGVIVKKKTTARDVFRLRDHDDDRTCRCGCRVTMRWKCCCTEKKGHAHALVRCPHCGQQYTDASFSALPAYKE